MRKIIKNKNLVPVTIADLNLDDSPDLNSTDPVTSRGIATAITEAVGTASDALQGQIDDIAEKAGSGYTPKGTASVATLNGLSGQQNGWLYTMTDAGTLTDGSVAVNAGDTVAWDATNEVWYKAMDYAPSQYGTNEIKNLPTTATEADLVAGNYFALDGAGTKKLPAEIIPASKIIDRGSATVSMINALTFKQDGWKFLLTDSGTLNNGSTKVFEGTCVVYDGSDGLWKRVDGNVVSSINSIFQNNASNPSDLNDIKGNTIILVKRTANTATLNFPSDYPTGSENGYLIVSQAKFLWNTDLTFQLLYIPSSGKIWFRFYNSDTSSWSAWENRGIEESLVPLVSPNGIFQNNATNPSDLNDLKNNSIILVKRSTNTATLNFPSDYPTGNENGYLFVASAKFFWNVNLTFQLLTIPSSGTSWFRLYNSSTSSWGAWEKIGGTGRVITIGSDGDYTTLREGIRAAYLANNAFVIVKPGTYDLLTEFSDKLHSINSTVTGICCGNGMKIFFCDGSKVNAIFDNSGSEWTQEEWEQILDYFSPFYAGTGDFEIENLNIEAQNCRYCFHDEKNGNGTYRHVFKNCHMIKRTTTPERKYMDCIGGGLGEHGTIVIDGGDYQSITDYGIAEIDNGNPSSGQRCISYHNGNNASAKGSVEIKNVYLHDRGWFSVKDYGPSESKTKFLFSACSMGLPIVYYKATAASKDNTEYLEWCCEQRVEGVHWELSNDKTSVTLVSE